MAQKTLSVKLTLNDKQFMTGLRKASSTMKKFGRNLQRTGQNLTRNLTLPIVAFGAASVKAFDDQVKAETKLRTALGGNAEAYSRLVNQAKELQKVTLFGDEATIEAQSFLAQLGLNEEAIFRLTPLIQDFASAQGIKLTDAAKLVAKSVGSSTNALSRYGIAISGAVGSQDRLESAVNALSTAFGGQSEAIAKEGLGPLTQLKNQLGDVAEEFGKIVLENIEPFKNSLQSLADRLSNLTDTQKKNIVEFSKYALIIGPLIFILGQLAISIGAIAKSIRLLSAALVRSPIGAFLTILSLATAALVAFGLESKEFSSYQEDMKKSTEDTNKELSTQEKLVTELNEATKTSAEKDLDKINTLRDKIKSLENENKNFQNLIDTHKLSNQIDEDYIKSIEKTIDANNNEIKSIEDSIKAFKDYKTEVRSLTFGELLALETRVNDIADAIADANLADLNRILPDVEDLGLEDIDEEEAIEEMGFNTSKVVERFNQLQDVTKDVQQTFGSFGNVLEGVFAQALQSTDGFFTTFVDGAKQAFKALMAQLAAMIAMKAILSAFGLGSFAEAGTGIGDFIGGLVVPSFATGGIVSGPTLGLMGEYAGARTNPEVIAPLDKLKSMIGTNGGSTEVFGTISGADILLSSDRARKNRNRTRGY
jgi:flagellar biosynthesis GTPase FlhF